MIIMADNNFLFKLVSDKQACRIFTQALEREEVVLGICTPVISEFMVYDDNLSRFDFLTKVNSFTQVYDFDLKSARLSATLFRDLLDINHIKQSNISRQVIKVDIQIIGITLANRIAKLYTTDKDIIEIVDKLSLPINIVDFEKDEFLGMPLFEDNDD